MQIEIFSYICTALKQGTIAQLVEHRTENPGVPGSTPGGTTSLEGNFGAFFVMYCCYIIYSAKKDKYYIGETRNLSERLILHNTGGLGPSFTSQSQDWILYLQIECETRQMSRQIERHIKRMKSRRYIENLK